VKLLFVVKRHRPSRPARAGINIALDLVGDVIVAQIYQPGPLVIHHVLQGILLAQRLHFVGQYAQHCALARLIQRDDFQQALICLLQVLNLDEVGLDQRRAEEAV